jgi:hypothetical protein
MMFCAHGPSSAGDFGVQLKIFLRLGVSLMPVTANGPYTSNDDRRSTRS